MCGITGILAKASISAATLEGMNDLISHRGPDDEGYVLFNKGVASIFGGKDTPSEVYESQITYCPNKAIRKNLIDDSYTLGLAHRRLAIVDISDSGHQPMSFENGRYWIVYNGEIYNYLELKKELEDLGILFQSTSDTEVILAAYSVWGSKCLSRLNGMWAFAIFDNELQQLFFARDRFGIKPLYYWYASNGVLCFCSEIKQLTAYPGWQAILNKQRAIDFLNHGLIDHTDETLFDGVFQIKPGHQVLINISNWTGEPRKLASRQWYLFQKKEIIGTFDTCVREFKRKFLSSISLHVKADVSLGSCLSGGLDSSSIVCAANLKLQSQGSMESLNTFTSCSTEMRFDERKWAEKVESEVKSDAHYVYPSLSELFYEMPKLTWIQDEPFGSTSIYAQWIIFRYAALNGMKVMLDGQGADEQLGGYDDYFALWFGILFYKGRWISLYREIAATKKQHQFSYPYIFGLLLRGILPTEARDWIKKIVHMNINARPKWINACDQGVSFDYPVRGNCFPPNSIREFSEQQLMKSNLQMLLHWEDRNSMACSIESRLPFLDYRLVEFSLNIPSEYKINQGLTKRILRQAVKNFVPFDVCNRADKMGFVTPEELWAIRDNPELIRLKLEDVVINSCNLINENIGNIFDEMIAGKRNYDFRVWRAISFSEWVKCFSVNPNVSP